MALLGAARAAVVLGIMVSAILADARAQQQTEQDVKAAFLFNFTKFVTWPAGFPKDGEPFRVCTIADERTTRAVDKMMQGEQVGGRPVRTAVPRTTDEATTCQILYVSRDARDRAASLLASVRNLPVLTVSDGQGFVSRGGAIQFVFDDGRIRFDINPANARAGLTISSRLLRVARGVGGGSE